MRFRARVDSKWKPIGLVRSTLEMALESHATPQYMTVGSTLRSRTGKHRNDSPRTSVVVQRHIIYTIYTSKLIYI